MKYIVEITTQYLRYVVEAEDEGGAHKDAKERWEAILEAQSLRPFIHIEKTDDDAPLGDIP